VDAVPALSRTFILPITSQETIASGPPAQVRFGVTASSADLDAVPAEERSRTLLMRKVRYAPIVETPDGNASKCEVRVMFVWRDGVPVAVTTLARLSQGRMMGVAFNKDRTWVGSSGCLWPA